MACQLGHIRCVFTVGSHVTNYYYSENVIVKNASILKLQIAIGVKNITSDAHKIIKYYNL